MNYFLETEKTFKTKYSTRKINTYLKHNNNNNNLLLLLLTEGIYQKNC